MKCTEPSWDANGDYCGFIRICSEWTAMKLLPVIPLLLAGLLAGCSATLMPAIKAKAAATAPYLVVVNGAGFSHTTPSCARLSVLGMPSGPPAASMGMAPCTNGTFQEFTWRYSYAAGCTLTGSQAIQVLAIDNPTFDPAVATVSIPWGPGCAFAGTCGAIGQNPCPSGCLQGSPDTRSGNCSCGAQGQPPCTTGNACQQGLNTLLQGSTKICGACGAQGQPPCTTGAACLPFMDPQLRGSAALCEPCSNQGQPPCATGIACLAGLNPLQQGSTTICAACGGEGQPLCTTGSACQAGLNPQQKGSGVACTASCGYTQGTSCPPGIGSCGGMPSTLELPDSPCVTQQRTSQGQIAIYTCYGHSLIDPSGSCTCVPNTVNSCQEDTSSTTGILNPTSQGACIHAQYLSCGN
jgi:hypothetical protein